MVNVAKAFQEKLRLKNQTKDSEEKEGDLERRKIKSVLGGSRGMFFLAITEQIVPDLIWVPDFFGSQEIWSPEIWAQRNLVPA